MDENQMSTLDDLAAALSADEGQATEAPESDADALPEQDESDREAGAPEGEQPEGEEAAEEEAGQATEAPADDAVVKWTTSSGEAIEAPLSELQQGYLRHADYTQKTQQLGEERRQAEALIAQEYQKALSLSKEHSELMTLQRDLDLYAKADWNALYAQDPNEAGRLQAQWRQTEAKAQQLAQGIQAARLQQDAKRTQSLQEATQKALETLQRDIPGFGTEVIKQARETAIAHGFTEAELNGITDARTLKVLHDAAQWRALQAKKPAVQNKVAATPPKASKPGKVVQPSSRKEIAFKQMQSARDVNSLAAFIAASE